jgi:hypothetical protein
VAAARGPARGKVTKVGKRTESKEVLPKRIDEYMNRAEQLKQAVDDEEKRPKKEARRWAAAARRTGRRPRPRGGVPVRVAAHGGQLR